MLPLENTKQVVSVSKWAAITRLVFLNPAYEIYKGHA